MRKSSVYLFCFMALSTLITELHILKHSQYESKQALQRRCCWRKDEWNWDASILQPSDRTSLKALARRVKSHHRTWLTLCCQVIKHVNWKKQHKVEMSYFCLFKFTLCSICMVIICVMKRPILGRIRTKKTSYVFWDLYSDTSPTWGKSLKLHLL